MLLKTIIALCFTLHLTSSFASELVKKSTSGICHDSSSYYYTRIKSYSSFDSLQSCLNSGGKLLKGKRSTTNLSSLKYSRSQFGHGWKDIDKDCQDTRTEALISQSVGAVHYKTVENCEIISGKWISPYSGAIIYKASTMDIDHIVPLKFAWDHGADKWSKEKRIQFANDPANLLSVEASLNRQKGSKGLAQWLPPKNQCQYILRFERIYKKYKSEIPSSEKQQYQTLQNKYC